jgi:hypothetical protein
MGDGQSSLARQTIGSYSQLVMGTEGKAITHRYQYHIDARYGIYEQRN